MANGAFNDSRDGDFDMDVDFTVEDKTSSPDSSAVSVASSSSATVRTYSYGLFNIYAPAPSASSNIEDGRMNSVDIVAVHGITGDAYDTWTHENGSLWLRDFIPKDLPGVRVFSYGYPADVFCTHNAGNLESFGRSLLEALKRDLLVLALRKG